MRLIKLLLISVFFFALLLTVISLFVPAHIKLSRAVNLSSGTGEIFELLEKEERWLPFFKDSMAAIEYASIKKNTVTKSDSMLRVEWIKNERNPVINTWQVYKTADADSVALQWQMDFHQRWYPWEKFSSLFYEKTYGAIMERGLVNIKTTLGQ